MILLIRVLCGFKSNLIESHSYSKHIFLLLVLIQLPPSFSTQTSTEYDFAYN